MLFGMQDRGLSMVLPGVLNLGSFSISYQKMAVLIFTLVVMIAMYIVLNRTKVGLAIRATAQQPDAASLYGVSVERLSLIVMGIGCGLAAMAGSIMAPVYSINPFMGRIPMIMSLLAIVIGGIGSLTGAIVGGIILGFLTASSRIICPTFPRSCSSCWSFLSCWSGRRGYLELLKMMTYY